MSKLSDEAKESILLKVINRGSESISSIAKRHNVAESSIYKWLKQNRDGAPLNNQQGHAKCYNQMTSAEKFNHILATTKLDEVSLGSYCREHGLYSYQLDEWRKEFMTNQKPTNNTNQKPTSNSKTQSELKALKEENKRLQRELRYKDKALAEASALLILKKKADLIWGEDEDD